MFRDLSGSTLGEMNVNAALLILAHNTYTLWGLQECCQQFSNLNFFWFEVWLTFFSFLFEFQIYFYWPTCDCWWYTDHWCVLHHVRKIPNLCRVAGTMLGLTPLSFLMMAWQCLSPEIGFVGFRLRRFCWTWWNEVGFTGSCLFYHDKQIKEVHSGKFLRDLTKH